MKKIVNSLLLVLSLFAISISRVYADNIIDFSKTGSIDILLTENDSNKPISEIGLTAIQIGKVNVKDNNLVIENVEENDACGVDFTSIEEDYQISEGLANCLYKEGKVIDTKVTDSNGKVSFTNLELGLYLVMQPEQVKGYSKIKAFSVMIPQVINNSWVYDISSEPKTEIKKLVDISITKEWNNEGMENPKEVEIELIRDELVVDLITLNEENNWTYTLEEMEMSDKYSVREVNVPANYTVSYRNEGYNFVVTNTAKLPQTGMVLWKVELMAFVGIVSIITGVLLKKKYEKI